MGKKSRQKQLPKQSPSREEAFSSCTLSVAVFGALCLLLAYPAYFRGLHFSGELLFTHVFTSLLLILWWLVKYRRKDYSFVSTPLDYCFLGLAAAYLLSVFVAVNVRGAIEEFLKVANFFLVYWLVKEVCVSRKQVRVILNVLVFSALGVALLGLGSLAGTWEIAGGIRDGRIFSTLQYANSLAAYLTSVFFLTVSLFYNATPVWKRIYTATALLLLVAAILTYSRGGWLVMAAFVPLFSLLVWRVGQGNSKLDGGGETVRLDFLWHRVLTHGLYSRIVSFSAQDSTVQERLRFYRDAWAIVRDYPLLGLGGQGWQSRNFQYQSAAYLSKTVHNHFLQLWVDAGISAVLFFLGMLVSFALLCIRLIRHPADNEQKVLVSALCLALFSVVTHSLYDFNLSLGAIGIYVAALLGLAGSFVAKRKGGRLLAPGLSVAAIMLLLFVSATLLLGHAEHQAGRRMLQEQRAGAALGRLERAVKLDPLNVEIRLDLARVYEGVGRARSDNDLIQKAAAQLARVLVLDRYHPRSSHPYGTFLIRNGQFDEGLDYLRQSLNLNPRFGRAYVFYAKHCLDKALELYFAGQKERAAAYLDRIFPLEAKLSEYVPGSNALALSLGQAHFMLGKREQAEKYLRKALAVDKDRAGAAMTLAALYGQLGERDKAREYFNRALYWEQESVSVYKAFMHVRMPL